MQLIKKKHPAALGFPADVLSHESAFVTAGSVPMQKGQGHANNSKIKGRGMGQQI